MPGYGIAAADKGSGLMPWATAETRLKDARNYWVTSTWPDGRPHLMPVWGAWFDDALWFSSGNRSRKARNLLRDPRASVATDDSDSPVVVDGPVERITDLAVIKRFVTVMNNKYGAGSMSVEFLDPSVNATFVLRPTWAFAIEHDDFAGSPTRWDFGSG